jgi:hypothetical protein
LRPPPAACDAAVRAARHARADGFIDPCLPTLAAKPPSGPHQGYRLIRDGPAVRGCSPAAATTGPTAIPPLPPSCAPNRSPWTARRWSLAPTAWAVFDALHRRHRATDAMLYAFDLLDSTARICGGCRWRAQGACKNGLGRWERHQATRNEPPISILDTFRPDVPLTRQSDAKVCSRFPYGSDDEDRLNSLPNAHTHQLCADTTTYPP